jgi:glycosyl transferase family 87
VFFCLALSLVAATSARPFLAALGFAFAVMIKPVLITAIAFFALVAGIRYIKYFIVVFAAIGLISVTVCGWYIHERFFQLMLQGVNNTVPWFYNSSLYVSLDNLIVLAPGDSWPATHVSWLNAIRTLLKLIVLATMALIVWRARAREWSRDAWAHFSFLMALCFFALLGHIVYEAYLTFVFVVLVYVLASWQSWSREARVLTGLVFCLSFWQNIIWVRLLQSVTRLDSVPELIAIGLFKSGPLILLLVLLWRHSREWLDSYRAPAWTGKAG